jgi:hypothetical protein
MIRFARALQLAGLVIVPVGLGIGFGQEGMQAETTELTFLGVGGFLFLVGTLILKKKAG